MEGETKMRIGIGYDVHKFQEDRKLILGGICIPYKMGLKGHSDADVLIHAIIDSISGASGMDDIGTLFPDNDVKYKNISSVILLEKVCALLKEMNFKIINIDTIIVCEEPKIKPFKNEMIEKLSKTMKIERKNINIKATTTEGLGFEGRKEGISAQAVILLEEGNDDWIKRVNKTV